MDRSESWLLSFNPFAEGTGAILLDKVNCRGNETSLTDCEHSEWGHHDCGHYEDVAIVCVDGIAGKSEHRCNFLHLFHKKF